jgi:putative DNA primase/helicase
VANLWALLVGRPGLLKSPAIEQAIKQVKRLAAKAIEAYTEAKRDHEADEKIHKARVEAIEAKVRKVLKDDPAADVKDMLVMDAEKEEPAMRRYIINDTSLESLVEILRQNPNGTLVHRDEMISLLNYLDTEANQSHRGFYLTGWNGNSRYTVDRIGRGFNR